MTKIINAYCMDTSARFKTARLQHGAGDVVAFAKTLHAMQGSCRSVGADGLAKLLQSVEMEGIRGILCTVERLSEVEMVFEQVCLELKAYLD